MTPESQAIRDRAVAHAREEFIAYCRKRRPEVIDQQGKTHILTAYFGIDALNKVITDDGRINFGVIQEATDDVVFQHNASVSIAGYAMKHHMLEGMDRRRFLQDYGLIRREGKTIMMPAHPRVYSIYAKNEQDVSLLWGVPMPVPPKKPAEAIASAAETKLPEPESPDIALGKHATPAPVTLTPTASPAPTPAIQGPAAASPATSTSKPLPDIDPHLPLAERLHLLQQRYAAVSQGNKKGIL